TIYETLTGQLPFAGERLPTVMRKILDEAPPAPSEIVPSLGTELDEVLLKALAKNRNQRYQKCSEFTADLKKVMRILQAPAASPTTPEPPAELSRTPEPPARPAFSVSAIDSVA